MSDYAIGTELLTPHGTRWVKIAPNRWHRRGDFGVLDEWTLYRDNEVYGDVVGTGEAE